MKKEFLAGIVVALFFTGCIGGSQSIENDLRYDSSGDAPIVSLNPRSDSYVIHQGDQLRVDILEYPEFDTTVTVGENGLVTLRLIGDVQAAGLTKAELAKQIIPRFAQYLSAKLTLTIVVTNSSLQRVAVLGAVLKQDNYTLTVNTPILQVLAMAGGATPEADVRHIKLFRGTDLSHPTELDLTRFMMYGEARPLPQVKPGDIVFVPREENVVRDLSNFFRDTIFLFSLFSIVR
jgi:polysaccharide biosynthesis/export protein